MEILAAAAASNVTESSGREIASELGMRGSPPYEIDATERIRRELSASNLGMLADGSRTRSRTHSHTSVPNVCQAPPKVNLLHKSKSFSYSQSASRDSDWRKTLSVEERQAMRKKIRDTLENSVPDYETLLTVFCDMEEESLFKMAPSRLDYFKTGGGFESRLKSKGVSSSSSSSDGGRLSPSSGRKRSESSGSDTNPSLVLEPGPSKRRNSRGDTTPRSPTSPVHAARSF
jgi:hypothetical protein